MLHAPYGRNTDLNHHGKKEPCNPQPHAALFKNLFLVGTNEFGDYGRVLCCSSGWWLRYFGPAVLILIRPGDERDVRLIKLGQLSG